MSSNRLVSEPGSTMGTDSLTTPNIGIFDGTGDFSLWKIRMMAHLGYRGLKDVLTDTKLEKVISISKSEGKKIESDGDDDNKSTSEEETKTVPDPVKIEKSERAKNLIVMNLGDKVLRKINVDDSVAEIWALLNHLYMESSLPNRIHLQLKFYTFKMAESKSIDQNVDDFLKIIAELGYLQVNVTDEVQAILLLTSLPANYDQLKHTLKYGRESLTLKEVIYAARSREREVTESDKTEKSSGAALYTSDRGRSSYRGYKDSKGKKPRGRSSSKSRLTCWFCKKEGHVKKDCFARKRQMGDENQGEAGVL